MELEQSKHSSTKIQEARSNVAITEKEGKICHTNHIYYRYLYQGTPGAFSGNVTPDIGYFTDEPIVQCNVSVIKYSSVDIANN